MQIECDPLLGRRKSLVVVNEVTMKFDSEPINIAGDNEIAQPAMLSRDGAEIVTFSPEAEDYPHVFG